MSQILLHWAELSTCVQKLLVPGVVGQLFSQLCTLFLGGGVSGCTQGGMLSHVFRGCLLKHQALGTCQDVQNSLHALTSGVDLDRVLATPIEAAQGRK